MSDGVIIGIDTSNYTTSVAAVDRGRELVSDRRKLLEVKKGEKGLRQQEAFFQHVSALPDLLSELKGDIGNREVLGISVSTRPRPADGSYMPVFMAGKSTADSLSAIMDVPVFYTSHQEGHVEAASYGNGVSADDGLVFFHLSGGTLEAVRCGDMKIIGKTGDISFGQLIDRVGVKLGMAFPCGRELDSLALKAPSGDRAVLPEIRVKDHSINLSGIENKMSTIIESGDYETDILAASLFDLICSALKNMMADIKKSYGITGFLFCGGVSSSRYIREKLFSEESNHIYFGKEELCSDNAVGTALIGGRRLWP